MDDFDTFNFYFLFVFFSPIFSFIGILGGVPLTEYFRGDTFYVHVLPPPVYDYSV